MKARATPPIKVKGHNRDMGTVPPEESRGKAPGHGVRGQKPPEADNISLI